MRIDTNKIKYLNPRVVIGLLGITFIFGAFFGQLVQPSPEPKVIHEETVRTEVVTKKSVEYKMDQRCVEAGQLALAIADATTEISNTGANMLDIMSKLRIAAVHLDSNAANDLETRLRKGDDALVTATKIIAETRELLASAIAECEKAQ